MLTEINICNIALARLGDIGNVANIDPPEGGAQAEHCSNFYPLARNTLLVMHDWTFARKQLDLAMVTPVSDSYFYSFAKPLDMLTLRDVRADNKSVPFSMISNDQGQFILANEKSVQGIYTCEVVDPTFFSPLFVEALTWQLASMLAGVIMKGDSGAQEAKRCAAYAQQYMQQAMVFDANQQRLVLMHVPEWVGAR
jgi:hypothetical protein